NARQEARRSGMLSMDLVPTGAKSFYLAPWTGTKELRTISKLLTCGLADTLDVYNVGVHDHYLHITSGLDLDEFLARCKNLQVDVNDPKLVLSDKQIPKVDKYDYMVPDEQLRSAYLHNQMDVPGALAVLRNLG
ncbi:MAG: ATP-dependent helicase, partial [Firmicutes bacterium]|nr:ATP-dependent helicase [Bacillota bacterium]